jgi:hypothetical protein
MKRVNLNYIVNIGLLVSFILTFVTGVIKMPELHAQAGSLRLQMGQLSLIHDWSGIAMGMLVFAHLALNWRSLVINTRRILGRRGG